MTGVKFFTNIFHFPKLVSYYVWKDICGSEERWSHTITNPYLDFFFLSVFFGCTTCSMNDFSSTVREWTNAHSSERVVSKPLVFQGSSTNPYLGLWLASLQHKYWLSWPSHWTHHPGIERSQVIIFFFQSERILSMSLPSQWKKGCQEFRYMFMSEKLILV